MADLSPGEAFRAEISEDYEFTPAEERLLDAVVTTLDHIAVLDATVERDGVITAGSKGQQVLHPAVREARQQRLALSRLLAQLEFPDEEGRPQVDSVASIAARRAADARWAQ